IKSQRVLSLGSVERDAGSLVCYLVLEMSAFVAGEETTVNRQLVWLAGEMPHHFLLPIRPSLCLDSGPTVFKCALSLPSVPNILCFSSWLNPLHTSIIPSPSLPPISPTPS